MSSSLPPAFTRGPVSTLQEMLRTISFVDQTIPFLRPTGQFDEATLASVLRFQQQNGLPVTGKVDRQTWDAIMEVFLKAYSQLSSPRALALFSSGDNAIQPGQSAPILHPIQGMFRALSDTLEGITAAPSTGVLDEGTQANLRWLQGHAGLPETGSLDQATWQILTRLFETFVSQKPVQVMGDQ